MLYPVHRAGLGLLLQLDQVLNAVIHLLHGFELGHSQARLVGDVEDSSHVLRVLAVNAADLQLQPVAGLLELRRIGADLNSIMAVGLD